MSARGRGYRYVGPVELKTAVRPGGGGRRIGSAADFGSWIAERSAEELAEPFTFVVGTDGVLRLAPRRSEHVACADADMVLSAGEISFTHEVVFRRCPGCQEHNIVREDDFVCVFCGSDLPAAWNVDPDPTA
ncbi:hypothetical protein ACFCXT_09075 [Streptomyces vinaceus]|uniref:hypothetical protein n=1 Tax=Streptomyces vinaceus TaxID=1960 RepID=UPI0035DF01FF